MRDRAHKIHTERPQPGIHKGTFLLWGNGANHYTTLQPFVLGLGLRWWIFLFKTFLLSKNIFWWALVMNAIFFVCIMSVHKDHIAIQFPPFLSPCSFFSLFHLFPLQVFHSASMEQSSWKMSNQAQAVSDVQNQSRVHKCLGPNSTQWCSFK